MRLDFKQESDQLEEHGPPVHSAKAAIPDLKYRNLYLQLCRGLPGDGENTRPSAAVATVLAAHPDLRARVEAVPRYHSDSNMVDTVGKQLETAFSNMFTLPAQESVSLARAKVLVGTHKHQRIMPSCQNG
ncbi:hypothetical protein QJQ45_022015 [Haematococcus lacustris]|nr:hypothetical protein QJQ45_022015 [Haematococcus lacustris]